MHWEARRVSFVALSLIASVALVPGSILCGQETKSTSPLTGEQMERVAEAKQLNDEAFRLYREGKYRDSLELAQRALKMVESSVGAEHLITAGMMNDVAGLHVSLGDYKKAESLNLLALKIRERDLGKEHPETLTSMNNLAGVYARFGDLPAAERILTQLLKIQEKLRPQDLATARSLGNLAGLTMTLGNYTKAESLVMRALKIHEKLLDPKDPRIAYNLNVLGQLYDEMGDFAKAEPYYRRSLKLREEALPPGHPSIAVSLSTLAMLYKKMGAYRQAETLDLRALQIREDALGAEHDETATTLNNLGLLYLALGDYARAETHLARALKIWERTLGPNDPAIAKNLQNLARLREITGGPSQAEELLIRAVAITEKSRGADHSETARVRTLLGRLHRIAGDYDKAEPLFRKAVESTLKLLEATSIAQSERQQLAMADDAVQFLDNYLQLAIASKQHEVTAYQFLLASKGSILNRQRLRLAMADDDRFAAKFGELREAASRLAALALKVPPPQHAAAWKRQITELSAAKERLEQELSRDSATFREAKLPTTVADIQAAFAPDTALVDFVQYVAYIPGDKQKNTKHRWEQRMAAFVLSKSQQVKLLDLGPVKPLAAEIKIWQDGSYGATADAQQAAQRLRQKLVTPLEPFLKDITRLLVSPDGELNKLPLAALPGKKGGTFLLEDFSLSVVPVVNGLVEKYQTAPPAKEPSGLLAIGDVNYDPLGAPANLVAAAPVASRAAKGLDAVKFIPLSGAAAEMLAVEKTFEATHRGETPARLTGHAATESAFRQAAPQHRVLHVATHGFFAPPNVRSALSRDAADEGFGMLSDQSLVGYHPDLLSGLAMAGANASPEEGDDGILTAAEVGTLDLRRVELVTLSACETGLGKSAGGEGLLGLQRAFQVAGARNVIASLWKVDDRATQALMTEFYTNIWRHGISPAEALRQAQMKMLVAYQPKAGKLRAGFEDARIDEKALADARTSLKPGDSTLPPFYWAAFVISGTGR